MKEIRWHGRGGNGGFTAARLLGYAASLHCGKYAQAFPSFGPERRGAPVLGFTRIDDAPITDHSQVYSCDCVIVLDETLLEVVNILEGLKEDGSVFINSTLPLKEEFVQTMRAGNPMLNQLSIQQSIAKQQLRIDQSGYLPDIALFGKQTLYAHGIQSNLVPRTMIGIGFTWNLFDGLAREKRIRQSRIAEQTLALGKEKAQDDLSVGIDKLYTGLQKAQDNVRALNSTIALSEELVRIRKKSFAEGMATSTEVVDAETMLATVKVARLAAYYEYDVTLMNLLALCGTPEQFKNFNN